MKKLNLNKNLGITLIEVTIAIGIMSAVSLGVMKISTDLNKVSSKGTFDTEVLLITNEINGILSNPKSCHETFRHLSINRINSIQLITSAIGVSPETFATKYATNTRYGNGNIIIDSYTLSPPNSIDPNLRELAIQFQTPRITQTGNGTGNTHRTKKVNLYFNNLGPPSNDFQCRAYSSAASEIWQKDGVLNIFYNAGNVGINKSNPANLLDVGGKVNSDSLEVANQITSGSLLVSGTVNSQGRLTSSGGLTNNGNASNAWVYFMGNAQGNAPASSSGLAFGWNKTGSEGESVMRYSNFSGSKPRLEFVSQGNSTTTTLEMTLMNGKLGIGDTGSNGPRGALDVQTIGDVYLTKDTSGTNDGKVFLPGRVYLSPILSGKDVSTGNLGILEVKRENGTGSTELLIRTTSSGNGVDSLFINPQGKVGLGTKTPLSQLHVKGAVQLSTLNSTCSSDLKGSIRYFLQTSNSDDLIEYCDGVDWSFLITEKSFQKKNPCHQRNGDLISGNIHICLTTNNSATCNSNGASLNRYHNYNVGGEGAVIIESYMSSPAMIETDSVCAISGFKWIYPRLADNNSTNVYVKAECPTGWTYTGYFAAASLNYSDDNIYPSPAYKIHRRVRSNHTKPQALGEKIETDLKIPVCRGTNNASGCIGDGEGQACREGNNQKSCYSAVTAIACKPN